MSLLSPIEELINYIISHIHEGLLMNKLDNQQLKSNISEGKYILTNVEFNSKSINQSLPYSTIHLQSAKTSKMNLFLPPLLKILDSNVKIRFTELELNFISAKLSGDTVSLTPSVALNKSDETPGLNVMTKSIGKFLSSINIEILLLSINLNNAKHSVNIQIPKLSISEENDEKFVRIEGISVFIDKFEPILVFDEVIEGTFKLNSSEFQVCLKMPDLFLMLSYGQLEILLEIFKELEVTDKFENVESGLIKTINEIGNKVDLGSGFKKQSGLVTLNKLDLILCKSKPAIFEAKYHLSLHEVLKSPHFHIRIEQLEIGYGEGAQLNFSDFLVNFFHVVEENHENLFKSAQSEFFHEFFDKETRESIIGTVCSKNVIKLKNGGKCLIEDDIQISFDAIKVEFNSVIFGEIMELVKIVSIGNEKIQLKEPKKMVNKTLKIQKITLSYQQEMKEIWTPGLNLSVNLKFLGLSVGLNEKSEIDILKAFLSIKKENEKFRVLEIDQLFIESVIRPFQTNFQQVNKKYSAFFEPNQGCITIANTKTIERKEKYKRVDELNNKEKYELEVITRASCSKCNISLGKKEIFNIFLIVLPELPNNDGDESGKKVTFYKTVLNTREIFLSFCEFSMQVGNLDVVSLQDYFEASISEIAFKSNTSRIISTGDKPAIITFTRNVLKIKLQDLFIDLKIFNDFSNFSIDLPEKPQGKNKDNTVFKIKLKNCSLIISNRSAYAILLIDDSRFLTFSQDFTCGSLKISSFKVLYSNQKLPENDFKFLLNNENLQVFASGSCISAEVSHQLTCYSKDCKLIIDDFYCSEKIIDKTCVLSILSAGTLILHVCKDTFDVLEGLIAEFSYKSESSLNNSIYFEANSSLNPKKVFHFHNSPQKFPEKSYERYTTGTISNIFIHIYPENEFPEKLGPKKSFFYQIIPKIHEINCVYFITKDSNCALSIEITDFQFLNSIKGCEIKKSLQKDPNPKFKSTKVLKLQVLSNSPLSKTEEITLNLSICPVMFTFDSAFIEFFLALLSNDGPELISESKPSIKIRTITTDPISLLINYIQPGTNMLNLINTENLQINLPKFEGQDFESLELALQEMLKIWQSHLEKHKILTLITRLSPIVSASNITKALLHLAKSPFDPYSEDGAKEGVKTLFKVFSVESLKFCDSFVIALGKLARVRVNQPFSVKFQRTFKYL